MNKSNILVYRNLVLGNSETFIYNQSIGLKKYKAYILGIRRSPAPDIKIPKEQLIIINEGGIIGFLKELLFRLFGFVTKDILEKILDINPLLIHAHFAIDAVNIIQLAQKLDIPLIISILGYDATIKDKYARFSSVSQFLYLMRRKHLIHKVKAIVVPTNFLRTKAIEQGFPAWKIVLIHHGVNLRLFTPSKKEPRQGHIVYAGRLVEVKGLNYLIKALGKLSKENVGFYLSVIGDGPMRHEFEELARSELADNYQFLGAQPHHIVSEYLSTCYIFSVPSVTMPDGQAETFGVVFAEAQAMGVPVVSFDSGGIPEVVENGVTGILGRERDVDDLARGLNQLLIDPALRKKMSDAARIRAELMFDLSKQNSELEAFYDEILNI